MATIRREQLAAVNINYRMYPFQDFLDTQRELGMKTIELLRPAVFCPKAEA